MPTQECFRTCLQHLGEFLKFLFGDGCRARLPTLVVGLGYSHFLCKLRLGQARTNPELLELRFHALPLVDLDVYYTYERFEVKIGLGSCWPQARVTVHAIAGVFGLGYARGREL